MVINGVTIPNIIAIIIFILFGFFVDFMLNDNAPLSEPHPLLYHIKKRTRWFTGLFNRKTYWARQNEPTVSFDQFYDMYKVNPKKWEVERFYVRYKKDEKWLSRVTTLYMTTKKDEHRLKKFYNELRTKEKIQQSNEDIEKVLTGVQSDIDKKIKEIQAKTEAEFKRIEEERRAKNADYERLQNQLKEMAGTATKVAVSYPVLTKEEWEKTFSAPASKIAAASTSKARYMLSFLENKEVIINSTGVVVHGTYSGVPVTQVYDAKGCYTIIGNKGYVTFEEGVKYEAV